MGTDGFSKVSINYFSEGSKLPPEIYEIATKYKCGSIGLNGKKNCDSLGYLYEFIWSSRFSDEAKNFRDEADNLENTISVHLAEGSGEEIFSL